MGRIAGIALSCGLSLLACGEGPGSADAGMDGGPADGAADATRDAGMPPDGGADVVLPALPPPDPCDETALDDPRAFPRCGLGAGVFGRWIVDRYGLPAYAYVADERYDARARYPTSRGPTTTDHWHAIGNDRVNAFAHNGGYVELVGTERGPTYYDRFDPDRGAYAGGFGWIAEGNDVWATAHRWLPLDASVERTFGLGYFEHASERGGLRVTHTVTAPPGDAPVLLDDVRIENRSERARTLRYYEYWDVDRFDVTFHPLVSGTLGRIADDERRALNASFTQSVAWDAATATLRAHMEPKPGFVRPPAGVADPVDSYPPDVFLVALDGTPSGVDTDQAAFFGGGGATAPDAVVAGTDAPPLAARDASDQPACFVMRHDLTVEPRGLVHLRYAFGYVPAGEPVPAEDGWRDSARDVVRETLDDWRARLVYLAAAEDPVLHREIAWRSYGLQAASTVSDYYGLHVIPQGSAYQYVQGLDGAGRDHALFAMPLTYVDPARAREQIELVMRTTRAMDGAISYAHHGHGVLEDAILHTRPSDLDLHLLLALCEYLAATGDRGFLDARVPFHGPGEHPPSVAGDTVLDHARNAFVHLRDDVSRGPHGLVRVGTGDWDDGIGATADLDARDASIARGESHANTAMAVWVLPQAAAVLESADGDLAAAMRAYAGELRAAMTPEWNGRWYRRAYLARGAETITVGDDRPLLLPQAWALIAGLPDPMQRDALEDAIDAMLDAPSEIGAALSPGGAVWPAVSQLLTWAYAADRPALAWRSLVRNTFAAHAEAYPDIWYGIWSGPDGVNGAAESMPGWTWTGSTPMQDFPVTNANQDAMGLLAALRVAGLSPFDGALRIAPVVPGDRFVLDAPLVRIEHDAGVLSGEYRAFVDGSITLRVALGGRGLDRVTLRGATVARPTVDGDDVVIDLAFTAGERVTFEVRSR